MSDHDTENKKSIVCLVVDDEEDIRNGLKRKLERRGFDVHAAADGQEALELSKKIAVDVIVTDIRMPRMTGIELLEAVKIALQEQCPTVICISAYSDISLESAYHKGADALFPKPLDSEALIAAIHHFYEARKQRLARWRETA